MQQVVDLQKDEAFKKMGVQLLAISPDPVTSWQKEGGSLGITVPELSDAGNEVWMKYGIPAWMMSTNEPGHTFFLVGADGEVDWVKDYGAMEHGGVMYVKPAELDSRLKDVLASP